jgi:hypothetical protein
MFLCLFVLSPGLDAAAGGIRYEIHNLFNIDAHFACVPATVIVLCHPQQLQARSRAPRLVSPNRNKTTSKRATKKKGNPKNTAMLDSQVKNGSQMVVVAAVY